MSYEAIMKRLGMDHLTFKEQGEQLNKDVKEIRRKEQEARQKLINSSH